MAFGHIFTKIHYNQNATDKGVIRLEYHLKFSHYANNEEPAFDVFTECHKIVFKGSDGNTEYLERLSEEAKLVYLIWCFDGEVHNGGFDQLFFNSLGNHC